jgi:hypothetical protein
MHARQASAHRGKTGRKRRISQAFRTVAVFAKEGGGRWHNALKSKRATGISNHPLSSGSGLASDAYHRHDHQNNRDQHHGVTNVVSYCPFCSNPIVECRRIRQRSDKQDVIPGIVKTVCDHVGQNQQRQPSSQPPSRDGSWLPVANDCHQEKKLRGGYHRSEKHSGVRRMIKTASMVQSNRATVVIRRIHDKLSRGSQKAEF